MYKRHFRIHKPTGVLETYIAPDRGVCLYDEYVYEPNHILVQGEITQDRANRKLGIWQYSDDKRCIYFTCPWCGMIGASEMVSAINTCTVESIWCRHPTYDAKKKGCGRHLTLSYRTPGKEKEFHHEEY